ncbi:MAG: Hsp20/alpha crystallin family protein [Promethearchaeota archaeon]
MSDDIDDYDDFFDELRKLIKFDSSLFDVEFFLFPEPDFNKNINDFDQKGYKVSYHFETGMDKPDVKIEGDIEENKLREYFKKYNMDELPQINKIMKSNNTSNRVYDANELSLEPCDRNDPSCEIEPYTEISDFEDFSEIIIEIPGINQDEILVNFHDEGRKLTFSAQNEKRNYVKQFQLPFKSSMDHYTIEVNNGIAILKVKSVF